MDRIRVYKDRQRRCWSVVSARTGRVTNYKTNPDGTRVKTLLQLVEVRYVAFVVRQAGWEQVIKKGVRGVHAWVSGAATTLTEDERASCVREVVYDPFVTGCGFAYKDSGEFVSGAPFAILADGRVYVPGG